MSLELFTMITEKPEVTQARVKFRAATEALKATALAVPDEDMPEEQEMWCLEWRQRLAALTKALGAEPLKGLGLGVEPANGPAFTATHDMCTREREAGGSRVLGEGEELAGDKEAVGGEPMDVSPVVTPTRKGKEKAVWQSSSQRGSGPTRRPLAEGTATRMGMTRTTTTTSSSRVKTTRWRW
ncbi:hypothetical protein BDN67DRAFT_985411 [Paxillus ammoniavirescens]|nr:hypothetical protein BDN67DRAFT_985411 [Paxillus ammoniavirescens]